MCLQDVENDNFPHSHRFQATCPPDDRAADTVRKPLRGDSQTGTKFLFLVLSFVLCVMYVPCIEQNKENEGCRVSEAQAGATARLRARPLSPDEMRAAAERVAERCGGDRDAVTVRALRAEAGSGSLETIARFLRSWRESTVTPLPAPKADLMPEDRDRLVNMAEEMLGVLIEREHKLREREAAEHERTLRDGEKEIERLTIQLGETGEEADKLADTLQAAQSEARDLKQQVDALTKERDLAQHDLGEAREMVERGKADLISAQDKAKAAELAAARATGERDQISRELTEAAGRIRSLEERAATLTSERDGIRQERDDVQREREEWRKKAEAADNALAAAITGRQAAENEVRISREAAARAEGQLEAMRATLAQLTISRPERSKAPTTRSGKIGKGSKDSEHGGAT